MEFSLSKDLATRKIEDEIFIFNRKTSRIHSFNASGTFLWEALEKTGNSRQLVSLLFEKYTVDENTAEHDVNEFLTNLHKIELIEIL